jgi:hypothetical protein
MAVRQFTFAADSAAETQTITLDGGEYRLRVRWSEPMGAWYADLYDANEQPLQVGRRLSPGYAPFLGHRRPAGIFIVDGPEGGPLTDLRGPLSLLYVEATE